MRRTLLSVLFVLLTTHLRAAEPLTLNVWPGKPPGETKTLPPESDLTKPTDALIAGRRIIKLGNVSTPQIAVYRPAADKDTGAAVVICPGGGHYILAYDLEGTEVAEWLNGLGVTGIVLKYRVPFRDEKNRSRAAVQDAQRAVSLVRQKADDWKIKKDRIGLLGFSAGGQVTAQVSLLGDARTYDAIDAADKIPSRPDFSILIYPGGITDKEGKLRDDLRVTAQAPPMFFAHAFDDGVSAENPLVLATALKRVGVTAELHLYAKGGHGYGLRPVEGIPVTRWTEPCAAWLKAMKVIP